MTRPTVSVVIVDWNSGALLDACLDSLRCQDVRANEVILVENGASSARQFGTNPGEHLIRPTTNLGFAGGGNLGASVAQGDVILFLNPDTALREGALRLLLDTFETYGDAIIGPSILNEDGSPQNAGIQVDITGHPQGIVGEEGHPFFVAGCALACSRTLFDRLGGFDESFFMFVEDLDLCWRAQLLGYPVRVADSSVVMHKGGGSLPGGYIRGRTLQTTATRVFLRERNTLAAVVTNYSASRAILVGGARIVLALAESVAFLVGRNPAAAASYFRALGWVIWRMPSLLQKRRHVQLTRVILDSQLQGVCRGLIKFRVLRRTGWPTVLSDNRNLSRRM